MPPRQFTDEEKDMLLSSAALTANAAAIAGPAADYRCLLRTNAQPRNITEEIKLHALHPTLCRPNAKAYLLPDFCSGATENPAASVRDYCYGAFVCTVSVLSYAPRAV
jgi:hypothetical protein